MQGFVRAGDGVEAGGDGADETDRFNAKGVGKMQDIETWWTL